MRKAEMSKDMQRLFRSIQERSQEQARREDRTGSRYTNADKVVWKVKEPPEKKHRSFSKD